MPKKAETVFKSLVRWIFVIVTVVTLVNIINVRYDFQCRDIQDVIKIRNQLSAELNEARKQIGQMQCEVILGLIKLNLKLR